MRVPVTMTCSTGLLAPWANRLAGLRYGLALSEGNGVKRDPVAAQRWLMQAQESGIPEAALAMGDMAARTPATPARPGAPAPGRPRPVN